MMNVSAKDIGLCSSRFCWLITTPATKAALGPMFLPFEVGAFQAVAATKLLKRPDLLEQMVTEMTSAREILARGLVHAGYTVINGDGPWVLVNFSDECANYVRRLYSAGIIVQDQSTIHPTLLRNWVRISATTQREAVEVLLGIQGLSLPKVSDDFAYKACPKFLSASGQCACRGNVSLCVA